MLTIQKNSKWGVSFHIRGHLTYVMKGADNSVIKQHVSSLGFYTLFLCHNTKTERDISGLRLKSL